MNWRVEPCCSCLTSPSTYAVEVVATYMLLMSGLCALMLLKCSEITSAVLHPKLLEFSQSLSYSEGWTVKLFPIKHLKFSWRLELLDL